MSLQIDNAVEKRLRLGAVGSLGAVTLLWLAHLEPVLFTVGTVLLTTFLVALGAGFRARGGLLLGLLFGVIWVAAKLGIMGPVETGDVLNVANTVSVVAMMALGVLSGALFGLPRRPASSQAGPRVADRPDREHPATSALSSTDPEEQIRQALGKHRDWMSEWDRREDPWVSFDNHLRELLRELTGARRTRCYRLDSAGELHPLNGAAPAEAPGAGPEDGLLNHVLTTGRRFLASSPGAGEMIRELARRSEASYAWVLPIRNRFGTCGLITVGEFEDGSIGEERLELAADLVEEFWHHLQQADGFRIACSMDRPSGVLDRVEILAILDQTVEACYADHEPVVMLALVVEGIRGMDDGGQWAIRNDVVQAIGETMRARLRHDDVLGRFSDDRFIAVLRRLDVPLAYLITRKVLKATKKELLKRFPHIPLTLRAGFAGSGLNRLPAQALLRKALDGIDEARARGAALLPCSKKATAPAEKA